MGKITKISWCHSTFSPWWGCRPVSEGCRNCYAAALAKRWGHDCFGEAPRRAMSEAYWRQPLRWARDAEAAGERRRVFCGSMCDVFERVRGADRLLDLVDATCDVLDWLLLTKRPSNIDTRRVMRAWIGTTVENQAAQGRVRDLCQHRARVRFLSCEPLLEPLPRLPLAGIDWVIVGGESGPHARPCDVEWVREIQEQCRPHGVAVWVKQLGRRPTAGGRPLKFQDRDGRDPTEWPAGLRQQEVPR